MNLHEAAETLEINVAKGKLTAQFPPRLIMPFNGQLPDDGVLTYRQVGSIQELATHGEDEVLVFGESEQELLEVYTKYSHLFQVDVKNLIGHPAGDYQPWWDSKTWQLDKVSYSAYLSELALAQAAAREKALREESVHDRERRQVSRADGTVRPVTKFDAHDVPADLDYPDEE